VQPLAFEGRRRRIDSAVLDHSNAERDAEKCGVTVDLCDARSEDRNACSGESFNRKLKLLDAAARLDDMLILAENRLESLKADQAGRHSIRVNDQYPVTFRWEGGHAYEVSVEDSH
jgi:plasmid maintenance system killer protein